MDKMKRLLVVLLTLCVMMVYMPAANMEAAVEPAVEGAEEVEAQIAEAVDAAVDEVEFEIGPEGLVGPDAESEVSEEWAEAPVVVEPVIEEPVAEESVAEDPVVEEIPDEDPVVVEAPVEEPVIEVPAEEPVIEEIPVEENTEAVEEAAEPVEDLMRLAGAITLTAAPKSGKTMSLSWTAYSGADSYEILYSTNGKSFSTAKTVGGAQTSTSHSGLNGGVRYWYRIQAKDASGAVIASSSDVAAVTLGAPILEAPQNRVGYVLLKWALPFRGEYSDIYRSESENGSYTCVRSGELNDFCFDTTAENGKTYYYKVRCYKKLDGISYYGGFSAPEKIKVAFVSMGTVENLTAEPRSGVTMDVRWQPYRGSDDIKTDYYNLYMSTDNKNFYREAVLMSSMSSYTHTGLTAGAQYWYRLRAKDNYGFTIAISEVKSGVALATPILNNPRSVSAGIEVSWSKASGADGYNVYRSSAEDGPYTFMQSVRNAQTYTDTTAVERKGYYYKVRAYKKLDGVVYYGGYSSPKKGIKMGVFKLTATPKSGVTIRLSWEGEPGAKYYQILYSDDGESFWDEKWTGAEQTSTSHTGLTAGTWHYYRVVAMDKDYNCISQSAVEVAPALATPIMSAPKKVSGGVKLTWSRASGSDRYDVYRSTTENGGYEYVGSVRKVETYTDTSVKANTTCFYKVRACKKLNDKAYFGGWSKVVKLRY